jgi:hypothetical protein
MKNLAKAILNVMHDVKGIEKNMTVGSGNYSYSGVSDQDVKKIIGESMQNHGLTLLPIDVEPSLHIDSWEETYNGNKKRKQSVLAEVKTKYLLLHESGESQEISGYGHGVDAQDKSAGKATTYALKYAMLYTFLVPTGKIDDADNTHSNEIPTPAPEKPWLTKEGFDYLMGKGSEAEIQKAFKDRRIKKDYRTQLENKLKQPQTA